MQLHTQNTVVGDYRTQPLHGRAVLVSSLPSRQQCRTSSASTRHAVSRQDNVSYGDDNDEDAPATELRRNRGATRQRDNYDYNSRRPETSQRSSRDRDSDSNGRRLFRNREDSPQGSMQIENQGEEEDLSEYTDLFGRPMAPPKPKQQPAIGSVENEVNDIDRRASGIRTQRPVSGGNSLIRGSRGLGRKARGLDDDSEAGQQTSDVVTVDERSTEPPQKPPKKPVVRPRLDLPVVRTDNRDKGTFYAEGSRFEEFGLSGEVLGALKTLGFRRPSHVQAATLGAWRSAETQHIAIADQAGSGKTLAYLLPIFQALRAQDAATGGKSTVPRCPRAIVLAPTVELVQQVYRVAKALSNAGAKLRVAAITGGEAEDKERAKSRRTQKEVLDQGVDLVIAAPGRLIEHLNKGHFDLSMCKAIVMDEVDVLLGDTAAFQAQIQPLRDAAPPSLRFVLVTATLPTHTAEELKQVFKDITLCSGPGLHRTAPGLVEELIDCSGGDEVSLESGIARKLQALEQALKTHAAPRTLIFCNKIESCRTVENALRRKYDNSEVEVLIYHEAIRDDLKQAAMNAFLSPLGQEGEALAHLRKHTGRGARRDSSSTAAAGMAGDAPDEQTGPQPVVTSKESNKQPRLIMIATDRMSRGIDCMYCQHVVLFDFPRDPSEYVRRVGRTARGAGGTGVVSCLVLGRQVALAREIIGRNQKGQPVHRIPKL